MIPCKDCLVLARCRNKNYSQLVTGCSILDKMLYYSNPKTATSRRKDFARILKEVDRLMSTNHQYGLVIPKRKRRVKI